MATVYFELKGKKYPIEINYTQALKILPEKFGINLAKVFTSGEEAASTMEILVLDDEKSLALAWHYIEPTASFDEEQFLTDMNGSLLDQFREDFWAAVVNFTGPLKRNLMREMWEQFKRDLKKVDLQTETSTASPSDSSQEG